MKMLSVSFDSVVAGFWTCAAARVSRAEEREAAKQKTQEAGESEEEN